MSSLQPKLACPVCLPPRAGFKRGDGAQKHLLTVLSLRQIRRGRLHLGGRGALSP